MMQARLVQYNFTSLMFFSYIMKTFQFALITTVVWYAATNIIAYTLFTVNDKNTVPNVFTI